MSAAEPLPTTTMPAMPRQRHRAASGRWAAAGAGDPDPLDLSTPRGRHHVSKREAVWALTMVVLLAVGIVGTLLLQTALQGEARMAQQQRIRLENLQQQADGLHRALAREADPALLARRARALHMHPQARPAFVRPGAAGALTRVAASRR